MSDLVKLHWYHAEDPSRDGHSILPRDRARRLKQWARTSLPDAHLWTFYATPFRPEAPFVVKLLAFFATLKADYLAAKSVFAFARLYWLHLVGVAVAIAAAIGVAFAPKWDRPVVGLALVGVAVIAFVLGRRTVGKS